MCTLPQRKDDHSRLVGFYQKCLTLKGRACQGDWNCVNCRCFINKQSPSSIVQMLNAPTKAFVKIWNAWDTYSDIHPSHMQQNCASLEQLCVTLSQHLFITVWGHNIAVHYCCLAKLTSCTLQDYKSELHSKSHGTEFQKPQFFRNNTEVS